MEDQKIIISKDPYEDEGEGRKGRSWFLARRQPLTNHLLPQQRSTWRRLCAHLQQSTLNTENKL